MSKAKFTLFTGSKPTVAKGYNIIGGALVKVAAENFYYGMVSRSLSSLMRCVRLGSVRRGMHSSCIWKVTRHHR